MFSGLDIQSISLVHLLTLLKFIPNYHQLLLISKQFRPLSVKRCGYLALISRVLNVYFINIKRCENHLEIAFFTNKELYISMQCLRQFSKNLRSAISGTILNFSEIKWLRFNVVFVKRPKSPFLTR